MRNDHHPNGVLVMASSTTTSDLPLSLSSTVDAVPPPPPPPPPSTITPIVASPKPLQMQSQKMHCTTRDDGKGGSEAAGLAHYNRKSSSYNIKSSSPESSVIPSFTSDSPYLQSYIDREMHDLHVLTETLRDISARARTFGKCGAIMAEATRRLSCACRLNPVNSGNDGSSSSDNNNGTKDDTTKSNDHLAAIMTERRQSIGDEMVSVLSVLGEILDEVADAQSSLCQSLQASLSLSLEAFAGVELNEANRLRTEGEVMSENAEQSFSRYMHGRWSERANLAGGIDVESAEAYDQQNFVASWNKLSDHVGSQFKNWTTDSEGNTNNTTGEVKGKLKNFRNMMQHRASGNDKDDEIERDTSLASAKAAANLRHNLEQIKLTQANAELKRFQLLKRLDSIKTRRNFELGESALASLNGLRTYLHQCSEMIEGVTPNVTLLQEKQVQSRKKHDAQQAPWETKEKRLTAAIGEVGVAAVNAGAIAEALHRGQVEDLDERMLSGHPSTLEEIESNVRFWELPRQLSIGSLYQRKPTNGIIVESWLYKKSTNRLSLNQWNRRWFILDNKGVYYLKGGEETTKKGSASEWMERVKVCDIMLCTVREINCKSQTKNNPNLRHCFEIISPNNKGACLLQACGPVDYKMWVSGIRDCIEQEYGHGTMPQESMFSGSNKTPSKRISAWSQDNVETEIILYDEEDEDNVILNQRSSPKKQLFDDSKSILMPQILDANSICADCENINPDWVSLNLGVVICIECSGVHRSLGVHVSKVRSLRMDDLTKYEYKLLIELGNETVNRTWEAGLHNQKGWKKPEGGASRKAKEEWIKSKYVWKGFLEYSDKDGGPDDREAKVSVEMYEAAKRGDLLAIQEALAKGGSVEWRNEAERGRTALHVCVLGMPEDENDIESWKGTQCAELLIQNGAKLTYEDYDHHKALDCAVVGNGRREMIEYLSARSS